MRTKSLDTKGFTFVESMICFSIVGIFLALTWSTVTFILAKTNDQTIRTRAHFLAMEGIELIKIIRQTAFNQNRETGFVEAIGKKEGLYHLEKADDFFTLEQDGVEMSEMQEDPFIDYCRVIEITGDSEIQKKVISPVSRGDPLCEFSEKAIRYATHLADLKK